MTARFASHPLASCIFTDTDADICIAACSGQRFLLRVRALGPLRSVILIILSLLLWWFALGYVIIVRTTCSDCKSAVDLRYLVQQLTDLICNDSVLG